MHCRSALSHDLVRLSTQPNASKAGNLHQTKIKFFQDYAAAKIISFHNIFKYERSNGFHSWEDVTL